MARSIEFLEGLREAKLLLGQDSDSDGEPDAKKAPDPNETNGEDLPVSKIPLVYRGIQKFRT